MERHDPNRDGHIFALSVILALITVTLSATVLYLNQNGLRGDGPVGLAIELAGVCLTYILMVAIAAAIVVEIIEQLRQESKDN